MIQQCDGIYWILVDTRECGRGLARAIFFAFITVLRTLGAAAADCAVFHHFEVFYCLNCHNLLQKYLLSHSVF